MIQGGSATQAKSRQSRKIRMGMIGGSQEAFIGAVHRRGSQLDGEIELVCGAFSSSAEKSKATTPIKKQMQEIEEQVEKLEDALEDARVKQLQQELYGEAVTA